MENNIIDDSPDQLFLFDSDKDKKDQDQEGSDPGSWLDEMLSHHVVQHTEPGFVCDPDKCEDDCDKCNIFRIPQK